MHKFSAPQVHVGNGQVLENTVVITDDLGRIAHFGTLSDYDPSEVKILDGVICPGFINTHCHLELSHLLGRVGTGTTLLPFLQAVVSTRSVDPSEIMAAIAANDQYMWEQGIMAVGDISNQLDTFKVKSESPIRYYTFVEMFDFLSEENAKNEFEKYKKVYDELAAFENEDGKDDFRAVPHAPYTVSKNLFKYINELNQPAGLVSIHNQETAAENLLFEKKEGEFIDFYKGFNNSLTDFTPNGKRSIHYAIEQMDPNQKTLFVHNTTCVKSDIDAAHHWNKQVYWATCPNANLYIENRLPNYKIFIECGAKMTIGTDSLSSNWQLSILEEIKTIQKYQSYVPLKDLIQWATGNGAEALGFDDNLGTLEIGKQPGLLNFAIDQNNNILANTTVTRLI